ncbi:uncharacterized protein [Diabrotica undecimpunctata]|uniref:uncharacterized protein n=1 Tax=Diabrotica undecimpunctata TaxID=50387 RepID=UPI003B639EFB
MQAKCCKCSVSCIFKEPKNSGEVFGYPCDFCKRVMCRSCAGISSTEIRCLLLATRIMPYLCKDCVAGIMNALNLNNRVSALENTLSEVKTASTQNIIELEEEIGKLSVEMKSLKTSYQTIYDDLKNDLRIIKESTTSNQSVSNAGNDNIQNCADVKGTDAVFGEIQDRTRRAKNIIIYNVPENHSSESNIRAEHDRNEVQGILNKIGVTNNTFKAFRLGRLTDKPRPLKVGFNDSAIVISCLKQRRSLMGSNLSIGADLTPLQREKIKAVYQELEFRKTQGENDLKIKYFNGVPKIIVSKSNNSKNDH